MQRKSAQKSRAASRRRCRGREETSCSIVGKPQLCLVLGCPAGPYVPSYEFTRRASAPVAPSRPRLFEFLPNSSLLARMRCEHHACHPEFSSALENRDDRPLSL